jgi:uncharacterized protein (TIGR03437 family)
VEIPASGGLTYWRIEIANNEDRILKEVQFPNLSGLPQLSRDAKNDYFVFPAFSGLLFQDPLHNFILNRGFGHGQFYPTGAQNMQFSAYYSAENRSGLYLAVYDTRGDSKVLAAGKYAPDSLSLAAIHPRPLVARQSFAPAYQTALGVFSGDWYDAAQLYRGWAQDQEWFRNSSLQRKDGAPDWFRRLPLHQWQVSHIDCTDWGMYSEAPVRAQSDADRIGAPVTADWTGWERFGWYIDYPKVFPPKEGWAAFDQAVARTQELGNRIWTVPNVASFSSRLPEWEQARDWAVLDSNGKPAAPVAYSECGLTTTFYQMCPATAFWRNELRGLLGELARRNVDIIQLDGLPINNQPCYSSAHGHLPGAPELRATAYRTLLETVKAEARQVNPKVQFGAEAMGDYYLGLLDNVSDPTTTGWSVADTAPSVLDPLQIEMVPLWHAVYHDATPIQSGCALIQQADKGERDYYARGLARALVWGEVPQYASDRFLADLSEPGAVTLIEYMKRVVHARTTYAAPFLTTGRMLRTPTLQAPEINLPAVTNIPYTGASYPPSKSPAVLGSLWRALTGEIGYVFTNISHAAVSFDLSVTERDTLLPGTGVYEIYLVRNGAYSLAEHAVKMPRKLTVSLAPHDVVLVGVAPSSGDAATPRVAPEGIVSAPSYLSEGVAPGEIFTIFGAGMGPEELAGLKLATDGRVATELANTRVLFDGVAAPLVYAHDRQVSGIAPYGIAGKTTTQVQVEYRGAISRAVAIPVNQTHPGIFTQDASGRGPGVIWNQDGTINTKANPARRGDLISFWATGEGAVTPAAADGQVTGASAPKPKAPVTVRIDAVESEILYAAAAPQAVAGVFQVNVRVPQDARAGDALPIVLTVGGARSQAGVTIAVK